MLQSINKMGRPLRHYVLVRLDIPLAQQIIQVGHACTQAAAKFGSMADSHLVLLGVADELTLRRADRDISDNGILRVLYEDPDLTGRFSNLHGVGASNRAFQSLRVVAL